MQDSSQCVYFSEIHVPVYTYMMHHDHDIQIIDLRSSAMFDISKLSKKFYPLYCTTVSFYQTRFPDIECLTGQVFTMMLIEKFPDKMEEAWFFNFLMV